MPRPIPEERPVTTSISLAQSKLDGYTTAAFELKYKSRNNLISKVLTDWLVQYEEQKKKRISK